MSLVAGDQRWVGFGSEMVRKGEGTCCLGSHRARV
jgi:hypothetical protein